MIGFAIVGCGTAARIHARALAMVPGARLAALVSRNPANARAVADAAGVACPWESELRCVLTRSDVHAVIVATPSGAHLEPAITAAEAGKHVIVEKPLEISLERCDRLIDACQRQGVTLATFFPSRFSDLSQVLKGTLDAGRFGRLTLAEASCKWWRTQAYYDEGGWKGTRSLDGGGALMNQGIHSLDLLCWLGGPVASVSGFTATLAHERIEVEDTAIACLRFASGALGVIRAATSAYPGLPRTLALHGDRGSAVAEENTLLSWELRPGLAEDPAIRARFAPKEQRPTGASDPDALSPANHARQLADMVEAIERGRTPLVDGQAGRKAVEVALGVYRSAHTAQVIELGP